MSRNMKAYNISAYECLWTGKNIKEVTRFFNLCKFDGYSIIKDGGDWLLYIDRLIDAKSIIITSKHFGIIGILENE